MTIQFCVGSSVNSLLDIYACSESYVYKIVWATIDAIIQCEELNYELDVSPEVRVSSISS